MAEAEPTTEQEATEDEFIPTDLQEQIDTEGVAEFEGAETPQAEQAEPERQDAHDQEPQPASTEEPDPLKALQHWPLAEREAFSKLGREVQQAWLDRDKRVDQFITERQQRIAPLFNSLEQWRNYAQQNYQVPPEQMFTNLAQMDMQMRSMQGTDEQKVQALLQLGDYYKIPWRDVLMGQQDAPVDPVTGEPDPVQAAIQKATKPLLDEIQALKGHNTNTQQQAAQNYQQARAHEFGSLLQRAQEAKAEDGNPQFPYLADVDQQMAQLYQAEFAQGHFDLSEGHFMDLYEQATWINPTVRQHLIANGGQNGEQPNGSQPGAQNGESGKPNSQQVVRKKQASSTLGGGTPTKPKDPDSVDDLMDQIIAEGGGIDL